MRKIDTIMQLCKVFLNKKQLAMLQNVLETVLHPSHCNKTNDEVLKAFVRNCRFRNLAEGTIEQEVRTVAQLSCSTETPLVEMETEDIRAFLEASLADGVSPHTINLKRAHLSSFFGFLMDEEWLTENPMRKIPKMKVEKHQKGSFSARDVAQLRSYCSNLRDRAMLEFLLSTGCRVSELCKMNIGDVNFSNRTAFIRQGKGKKDRTVAFSEECAKHLQKYLLKRKDRSDEAPLIGQISRHREILDERLKRNSVEKWFERAGEWCNVENCHPHTCRHYCITSLIRNEMPIKLVSMQAGHASISTTVDIYDNQTHDEMLTAYQTAMG